MIKIIKKTVRFSPAVKKCFRFGFFFSVSLYIWSVICLIMYNSSGEAVYSFMSDELLAGAFDSFTAAAVTTLLGDIIIKLGGYEEDE